MDSESHVKKPIVTGKELQKSPFKRALSVFLADDIDAVKDSIVDDYIKPRMNDFKKDAIRKFKEFIVDSIQGCVEMLVLGSTSKRRSYRDNDGRVQYFRMFDNKKNEIVSTGKEVYEEKFALKLYTVPNYDDAIELRDTLREIISRYNHATVADYYDLVDAQPRSCDHNYGWIDLEGVDIYRADNGEYVVDLPKPVPMPRNR